MTNTILRYLKENMTSTVIWLATILTWLLWFLGVPKVGHWLLVSAMTIFVLIMIIGQLKDKIKDLQEKLDKFKI
jgi:uncharacterized membrane protein